MLGGTQADLVLGSLRKQTFYKIVHMVENYFDALYVAFTKCS
jgi:hypothetical protein